MYMFDVETLGVESTAVILSAAILYFEEGDDYDTLLKKALFVKLDSKYQIEHLKRTVDPETLKWWSNIHPSIRELSFVPHPSDMHPAEGIDKIKQYVKQYGPNVVWARGSLDQMVIDSLCTKLDTDKIVPYNNWRDVRTGVEILCSTAKNGYCDVNHPTFGRHNVIKHHPVHDCALDAMMLLYGV